MPQGFVLGGAVGIVMIAAITIVMYLLPDRRSQRPHSANSPEPPKSNSCGICCESFECSEILILDCTHIFHKYCLTVLVENEVKHKRSCPICRAYITESFIQNKLM